MPKMMHFIYGTYGPRHLEGRKPIESGREIGWVTLGHTFSCGHVIMSLGQRPVYVASIYIKTFPLLHTSKFEQIKARDITTFSPHFMRVGWGGGGGWVVEGMIGSQ